MNSKDYRNILLNIYEYYHPEKMKDVKELLSKYKGQEEKLLQAVYEKYNISVKDRLAFETTNNIASDVNTEEATTAEIAGNRTSAKTTWIATCIVLLLLVVSGVWYANNQHNLEDNPREEETNNLQETIIHTPVDTIKKYPSLALNDLAQLRLHPDQTSKIEQKGYYLIASKDNIRTFVGTLCDTVIINKKWVNDIVKISWQAGTNRHWLYNRMRAEMRKKYPYSEMLSNNDETDNELKGLQYFKDECYVDDGGIQYRVIVTYSKGKVIGYGLEVNADY